MMKATSARNPQWIDAAGSGIDLLATFEGLGEVPFTAHQDDIEPHGVDLYSRAVAGEFGPIADAPAPSLADRQKAVVGKVEALRDQKLASFAYDFGSAGGVQHLQVRDTDDRTNWLTLRSQAQALIASGQGAALMPLRTAENNTLQLAATMIETVLSALAQYGSAVMAASWALKDAVRASSDPESIDITAGWPA